MADTTPLSLLDSLQRRIGDDACWQRFVDLYSSWLRSWLWRMAHLREGDADADDVVQNVFLVVQRRLPTFQHNGRPGAFRAWLKQILIYCLRDFQKKQRALPGSLQTVGTVIEQMEDPNSELSQLWEQEHQVHVLQQLLARGKKRFPAYSWTVFERTVLEGKPTREVAGELQVSENAVLLAKSRVLAWLRKEGQQLLE